MNCRKIEEKGIKTVILTDEYAGRDGASQSLADADPKANAVITNGNANETIVLPHMNRLIGTTAFIDSIAGGFDGSLREDGSIEVELQAITGATNETGFGHLSAAAY
jgi:glycine reductase complex component B subunit alpha and beta